MWVSYFTWACHQGLGFKDPSCPCCKNLTDKEWIKKQIKEKRKMLSAKCACGDLIAHENMCDLVFGEDHEKMCELYWNEDERGLKIASSMELNAQVDSDVEINSDNGRE